VEFFGDEINRPQTPEKPEDELTVPEKINKKFEKILKN